MATQQLPNPSTNPGLYSYGSNRLGSRRIFFERKFYDENIFPDTLSPYFFETWGKDRYYGTINSQGNAVVPQEDQLKSLRFPKEKQKFTLNFVADAWRDLATRLRELTNQNILYQNSPWAQPLAVAAYQPPSEEYNRYLNDSIFPIFATEVLGRLNLNQEITGFGNFLDVFSLYISQIVEGNGPLTYSGFIESYFCSPLSSGLMIEIADAEYDRDFEKGYSFKDRNFDLITRIAAEYGFGIDKNIPWRLVADLSNPAMQEYMYGVPIVELDLEGPPPDRCHPDDLDPEFDPGAFGFSQIPGLEHVLRRVSVYVEDEVIKPGYAQYQSVRSAASSRQIAEIYFSSATNETWNMDMDIFAPLMVGYYNKLIESAPTIALLPKFIPNARCPQRAELLERHLMPADAFEETYGDRWKIKTFYILRMAEMGLSNLDNLLRMHQLQEAMNVYNLGGNSLLQALKYIQESFIGALTPSSGTGTMDGEQFSRNPNDISDSGQQTGLYRDLY
jgi:hypothetical protein